MSRAGFSIRKLIHQRRTWPDSDDETDDAFECSSAKTIRVQYELEQYQQHQSLKDGRHQISKDRASWMSNNGEPKKKSHRKAPKPIKITRHASDDALLKNGSGSGSANRRISSPVPISSHTGRLTPSTPLYSRSSEESLDGVDGNTCKLSQYQQLRVPRRAASAVDNHHSPRLCAADASGLTPTCAPPTATKCSYEQSIPQNDKVVSSSGVCSSTSHQLGHPTDYIDHLYVRTLAGVCMSTSPQPTYTTNPIDESYIKTPVLNGSIQNVTRNTPEYQKSNQTITPQYPEFANGVPSPPLDSEEAESEHADSSTGPAMGQPMTKSARDSESTWFLSEGDGEAVDEDMQQLTWRTDEAFKAVSAALAEINREDPTHPQAKQLQAQLRHLQHTSQMLHAQTHATKKPVLPSIPTPSRTYPSVQDLVSPISPTSGRGTMASRKSASPLSPSPNILRSPTRGTSISKTKRGPKSPGRPKTPRSATHESSPSKPSSSSGPSSKGLNGHRYQHSYHRSLSKLNLAADNVTDKLFNGSRGRFGLHRIEADEMVTSAQVEQFRQARLARAEAEAREPVPHSMIRNYDEDGHISTTSNDTPVELRHLQELPSRFGNSVVGAAAHGLSPVVEVPTPRFFELNKDGTQQNTFFSETKTSTDITKSLELGQTLIVTPPPTPPQTYSDAAFNNPDPTSKTHITDEDESMSLLSLGLQRLLPSKQSRKHTHSRTNSASSRIPILPTIPELKITAAQTSETTPQSQSLQGRITPESIEGEQSVATPTAHAVNPFFHEDDEHIWLVSPAYSKIMPTMQHGPIRLAKDDLVNHGAINSIEAKLMASPDETMDWIAFQMAILGGAGELNSNPDDFLTRDAQEDLVDDLCEWFEGFGLPNNSLGNLITKKENPKPTSIPLTPQSSLTTSKSLPPTPQPKRTPRSQPQHDLSTFLKSTPNPQDSMEVAKEEQEQDHSQSMPIPVTTEHPSGFWNTRPRDTSRFFTGSGCGLKRWTLEGHPKRYQGPGIDVEKANNNDTLVLRSNTRASPSPRPLHSAKSVVRHSRGIRESVDSLPQSPMLDLVMTTGVDGSKDFVPMGYNLGHDLGDFLKWESEHVYASGFYGAD